jgi:hypothetical protein
MIRLRNPLRSLFGTAHGIPERRVPNPGDLDACALTAYQYASSPADHRARLVKCGADPDATTMASVRAASSRLAERRWRLPPGQRWVRAGDLRGE